MTWLSSIFAWLAGSTLGKLILNMIVRKAQKLIKDLWQRYVVLPSVQSEKKAEHDKALSEYHSVILTPDISNQEQEDAFKKFIDVIRPNNKPGN